jgi:hypothetical protein
VRSIIASSQMLISIMWTTATTTFEQVKATFRIENKAPELWRADTGQIEPAAYHIENGRTAVRCTLICTRRSSSSLQTGNISLAHSAAKKRRQLHR